MNDGGRDEERKQVRKGEGEGMLGSAERREGQRERGGDREREGERGKAKTKAMACCDKHWLKSKKDLIVLVQMSVCHC